MQALCLKVKNSTSDFSKHVSANLSCMPILSASLQTNLKLGYQMQHSSQPFTLAEEYLKRKYLSTRDIAQMKSTPTCLKHIFPLSSFTQVLFTGGKVFKNDRHPSAYTLCTLST